MKKKMKKKTSPLTEIKRTPFVKLAEEQLNEIAGAPGSATDIRSTRAILTIGLQIIEEMKRSNDILESILEEKHDN